MTRFPEHAQLANIEFIEHLYEQYIKDPESVESSWRYFFQGIDFGAYLNQMKKPGSGSESLRILKLIQAYRRYGHLEAQFNPIKTKKEKVVELDLENLGFFDAELKETFPTFGFCAKKEAPLHGIIQQLKEIYSSRIGFEFVDCDDSNLKLWIQNRIEPELKIDLSIEEKHLLLDSLNRSEILETFLHAKYVGVTRFSLEGAETLIPILAEIIERGADFGLLEFFICMAHRGRLNVLTNILNKSLETLLAEFEDDISLSYFGSDDVKYHMGYVGEWVSHLDKKLTVGVAANPSHLESVNPVAMGQVYAKQILAKDHEKKQIIPLVIHGDAAIAGQGVVYETMQLMNLPNYCVGGSIHIVVNNQIGYTTLPKEYRSTRYCTDIAKAFGCPVFHVNAEDPESCIFAAKLAVEIRQTFHIDVFIDLVCYRKYGHNEGDEPSYTQPLEYRLIRDKKPIRQIYLDQLLKAGMLEKKMGESLEIQFKKVLNESLQKVKKKVEKIEPTIEKFDFFKPVATNISKENLEKVLNIFCTVPKNFHLHPKLQKWLENRRKSLATQIDWATAECLSFGTLLDQGLRIRLAGQDSQRGTFSQRHLIWTDSESGQIHCPLCSLKGEFEVVNSALTEYASMGFEFGFSCSAEDSLSIWEAQYGDFDNGAQIIIDQYIVCSEQKWKVPSKLTLLLPHGYEGAGPEHSSARPERFLQLAAKNNIQIVNPSTPAQYFHLLRRQTLSEVKKPLIVFTPKSLLRSPLCVSKPIDLIKNTFQEFLDDPNPPKNCKRLIFCTGKIFYDLLAKRTREDVAIIRIEQLYPLHLEALKFFFQKYQGFQECAWVQEEPENMGAWNYIGPYLQSIVSKLYYVGREQSGATATGSSNKHKQEQASLIERAFKAL